MSKQNFVTDQIIQRVFGSSRIAEIALVSNSISSLVSLIGIDLE